MKQALKSQQSIETILNAALSCFSHSGYKGTSMKEIASAANISIGRVYHHFQNKLQIFTRLLDRYWTVLNDPESDLNRLIRDARYPDDIEELAYAIKAIVENNRSSILLIYIDVIEFQGEHINRVYRNMAANFKRAYKDRFDGLKESKQLNEGADPHFAVMMTIRFLFHYFLVETSFGVSDHFGFTSDEVIRKTRDIVLHGLIRSQQGTS